MRLIDSPTELIGRNKPGPFLMSIVQVTVVRQTDNIVPLLLIGGKKLCPSISPKKTVAGFVGGLFGGMLVAVIMFLLFERFELFPESGYVPFTDATWKSALIYLAIGLVGALAGQLGDLAASRIKRALGIKDFGKIFPGHGGIMDRFDSIIAGVIVLLVSFSIVYGAQGMLAL